MITVYCIISCILFLILFVVWNKGNWLNLFIKTILFLIAIFGIICSLISGKVL